ncbi:hypothetical protein HU200_007958 [Digitaria exilis]|uniref:Uncharacterized protein n=1 Tax=Digitaria exilis TaxID=1010633 RepID=A0A835FNL7_9POAL|nr:hypothetical protein HU200_007958 [Digitaria exilis]
MAISREEAMTGSHVFTIDGFSLSKGAELDRSISSPTFTAAGHRWLLRYYPHADTTWGSWISMYLQLAPCAMRDVTARFTISLLDWNDQPVPSCTHAVTRPRRFSTSGYFDTMAGFRKFIKRKALKRSGHLVGDRFRVRVDITVSNETTILGGATGVANAPVRSAVAPPPPPPPPSHKVVPVSKKEMTKEEDDDTLARFVVVPPPDMDRHLGRLLSSGEGADVTIEVGGETFMAHRTVLAARCLAPWRRGPRRHVIKDMEASVFKVLLHFVYTDSLSPDVEDEGEAMAVAQHLLVAADRYGMERLKLMCEDKLCNYVGASSVGTILALADQHGCEGLKKACLKFLMSGSNLKEAIVTDGFDHLAKSCPSVLKELLSKVALDLLSRMEGMDVMFKLVGEMVLAHRCILAAQPDTEVCVWVEEIDVSMFKAMLHLVYTDSLPEVEEEGAAGSEAKTTTMSRRPWRGDCWAWRFGMVERLKLMC